MRMIAEPDDLRSPEAAINEQCWQGLPARIAQVLSSAGLNQTELARQLGLSPGFMSEIARGVKRPGPDFFMGLHRLLGISIDWMMTGEGTMTGGACIRQELLQAIRLQVAIARSAINDGDPVARALLLLVREGQLAAAAADPEFGKLLDRLGPSDPDLDLAVELYNGHLWTMDPIAQRRNLLAAAVAHFETRRPIDRLAAITGSRDPVNAPLVQINKGRGQRVAGRDYHEHRVDESRKK